VTSASKPFRLPAAFKEKIWGTTNLAPWFESSSNKIGEVWFEADLPILIKFVFTSERLSVQVHPDDAFAAAHEASRGKTEMWHVLRAGPEARIALGFRERIDPERMRQAALSGEIERLLHCFKVKAGETFFVPAGTVHAIGADLAVCEIQQHSDVTYRLYDYGRPRELHLDKAMQVADAGPADATPRAFPVECQYFRTDELRLSAPLQYETDERRFHALVFLSGHGRIAGEAYREGEAWLAPAGTAPFRIEPDSATRLLRVWVP
jgi:mannose-6-phosphate isomerase